jgi:hypothetical protein
MISGERVDHLSIVLASVSLAISFGTLMTAWMRLPACLISRLLSMTTYENDSYNFLHFSNLNISLGAESKINSLCVFQSSRIGNLLSIGGAAGSHRTDIHRTDSADAPSDMD